MSSRLAHFWFAPTPPTDLAVCRVLFCAGILAVYLPVDFSRWGAVSHAFWIPLPLFEALHLAPLGVGALDALQMLWRGALVLAAIGWHTTASLFAAATLGFYLLGLPHNFGHVYHFDALLVIALAVLACSRAGDAWSIDALLRRRQTRRVVEASGEYTWPIRLVWTATALVFLAAGVSKVRHGGIAWVASENLSIVLTSAAYHVSDADPITTAGLWIARHGFLSRALALASLTIELTFAAALFSRRARLVLVPAAAAMLVGIRVLMGPTFGGFLLVNVFWVPWRATWLRLSAVARTDASAAAVSPAPLDPRRAAPSATVASMWRRDDSQEESVVRTSAAGNVGFEKR